MRDDAAVHGILQDLADRSLGPRSLGPRRDEGGGKVWDYAYFMDLLKEDMKRSKRSFTGGPLNGLPLKRAMREGMKSEEVSMCFISKMAKL